MRLRHILMAVAMMAAAVTAQAKDKVQTVWIYGFAASFNDSTVYFTEIQRVDSAWVGAKTHFLYGRQDYSAQLAAYLERQGLAHATCITAFGLTRKEAEKKYMALRQRYLKDNKYDIKYIKREEFAYEAVAPAEEVE